MILNFLALIVSFAILYWIFVVWYEGKKDGFDEERFYDIVFLSLILGIVSYLGITRLLNHLKIYYPQNLLLQIDSVQSVFVFSLLLSLLPVFFLSKKNKWSVFRILDIYSLGFGILLFLVGLGVFVNSGELSFLFLSLSSIVLHIFVLRFRGYKFISGLIFSFFTFYLASIGFIFFRTKGFFIFYPLLVLLGIINLYSRRKKIMFKRSLSATFTDFIKQKLLKKKKELQVGQELLIKEDPYLQPGRSEGNAEIMDEAILEDQKKVQIDAEISNIKESKQQVEKALGAMASGTYGICEVCGNQIDSARLKSYPEATTCINCEKDEEQKEEYL